ncbi:MAG TPA: VirB3 family type IV secretion system protein [Steroidobacteraceae bacterium]|jgi:type IV secretion system protein VirB3
MVSHAPGLISEPLFVGATRPPMRWGVTYSALLFNLVLTLEAFLLTHNLVVLIAFIPIHGLCSLLCARDPRYFDLLLLWGRTRLSAPRYQRRRWGAASYGPMAVDLPNHCGRRRRPDLAPRLWCAPPEVSC